MGCVDVGREPGWHFPLPLGRAVVIHNCMPGDLEHPRDQSAGILQAIQPVVHTQEHLLQDVFDLGMVRHAPGHEGPKAVTELEPALFNVLCHDGHTYRSQTIITNGSLRLQPCARTVAHRPRRNRSANSRPSPSAIASLAAAPAQ